MIIGLVIEGFTLLVTIIGGIFTFSFKFGQMNSEIDALEKDLNEIKNRATEDRQKLAVLEVSLHESDVKAVETSTTLSTIADRLTRMEYKLDELINNKNALS